MRMNGQMLGMSGYKENINRFECEIGDSGGGGEDGGYFEMKMIGGFKFYNFHFLIL